MVCQAGRGAILRPQGEEWEVIFTHNNESPAFGYGVEGALSWDIGNSNSPIYGLHPSVEEIPDGAPFGNQVVSIHCGNGAFWTQRGVWTGLYLPAGTTLRLSAWYRAGPLYSHWLNTDGNRRCVNIGYAGSANAIHKANIVDVTVQEWTYFSNIVVSNNTNHIFAGYELVGTAVPATDCRGYIDGFTIEKLIE